MCGAVSEMINQMMKRWFVCRNAAMKTALLVALVSIRRYCLARPMEGQPWSARCLSEPRALTAALFTAVMLLVLALSQTHAIHLGVSPIK